MKKLFACAFVLAFALYAGCTQKISSSELKSTKAKDVEISGGATEVNNQTLAEVHALLKTIPDDVEIKFDQGETLSVATESNGGSLSESVFLSYNENLFNIGESYVTNVAKPPVGNDYIIIYKDADGEKTSAVFTSQGVPELIMPVDKQTLTIGQKTELTWTTQNLGSMSLEINYTNTSGGSTYYRNNTVLDDGSYELDLGADAFKDAANGDANIALIHSTTNDSMPGFGKANITVESRSERDCTFTGQTAKSTKAMQAKGKLSKEEMKAQCSFKCSTGESKFVMFENTKIDCCMK